jgi:hypothetical protein
VSLVTDYDVGVPDDPSAPPVTATAVVEVFERTTNGCASSCWQPSAVGPQPRRLPERLAHARL